MKQCNGPCNSIKPHNLFHRGNGSFGLKSRCIDCCKLTYKIKSKEQARAYYLKNHDKLKEYKRSYYIKNINKERYIRKQFDKNNLDRKLARENKRRAQKLNATPKWLTLKHFEQIESIYVLSSFLSRLLETKLHVDHVLPLQGKNHVDYMFLGI